MSRVSMWLVLMLVIITQLFINYNSLILTGCEHNGKFFDDGDRIPNAESPCYSCYCQGSSITCALADCKFRFDCEPEYVPGECCPRYEHCPPEPTLSTTASTPTTFFTTVIASNATLVPSSSLFPTTTTMTTIESGVKSSPSPGDLVHDGDETVLTTTTTKTTSVSGSSQDGISNEPENDLSTFPVSQTTPGEEVVSTEKISIEENKDTIVSQEGSVTTTVIPVEAVTTLTPGIESSSSSSSSTTETSEVKEHLEAQDEVMITIRPLDSVSGGDQNEISVPSSSSAVSEVTTKVPDLIIPEDYPTTTSWIPDTSLSAEHRGALSVTKTRNVSNAVDANNHDELTTPLPSLDSRVSVAEGVIQTEVTTAIPSNLFDDDEVKLPAVVGSPDTSLIEDDMISVL